MGSGKGTGSWWGCSQGFALGTGPAASGYSSPGTSASGEKLERRRLLVETSEMAAKQRGKAGRGATAPNARPPTQTCTTAHVGQDSLWGRAVRNRGPGSCGHTRVHHCRGPACFPSCRLLFHLQNLSKTRAFGGQIAVS